MDRTWKFLGSGILIHTLELKLWHFKVLPYVCTGKPCICNVFRPRAHKRDDLYPICSARRMDRTWKFLGSGILIHTLELKLWHFEVFPYVCIGSHAFAMFAHKKNYGRAGYVDDPLPNIVNNAIWMPACSTMHPARLCGGFQTIFFLLSVWSP